MSEPIKPLSALAEDLRRFGIILLAAGVIAGFLQGQITSVASAVAVVIGAFLMIVGSWLHHKEART